MRRDWQPLVWFSERDEHGHYWCVILTSDDLHPKIRGCFGLTLCGGHTVLIWAGQPLSELRDTLLHEMAHVHCWSHGRAINEQSIRRVIPRLLTTLRRQGWQMPPLPDGYRNLAAHARYVRHGRQGEGE